LRVIDWERPDTAVCLVIDRSGSMKGEALASAALAAAAVALRAPAFHAVIAF
jgi:cobalamin biosynthesis protein CobT